MNESLVEKKTVSVRKSATEATCRRISLALRLY